MQTNQFARAVDIARELRARGIQVAIGGFHVSGCLAMLPELTPDLKEALALGITLFAGEAEGRLEDIFRAAYENRLEPLYNFMKDMPDLGNRPLPFLPERYVARYAGEARMFRRRARLSICVQLLQHHQRAGPKIPLPDRG